MGISIHAPAKGATNGTDEPENGSDISIHAPAKGATYTASGDDGLVKISIHAPAKGATAQINNAVWGEIAFQSTLPRRERRKRLVMRSGC